MQPLQHYSPFVENNLANSLPVLENPGTRINKIISNNAELHLNSSPSSQNSRDGQCSDAPPGTASHSTTADIASFRSKRIRNHNAKSATTLLKNACHGLLRALVQECTDMKCAITAANKCSDQ